MPICAANARNADRTSALSKKPHCPGEVRNPRRTARPQTPVTGRGSAEHRHLDQGTPRSLSCFADARRSLLRLTGGPAYDRFRPVGPLSHQCNRPAPDYRVCQRDHLRGRAVVPHQLDPDGVGVPLREGVQENR